MRRRGGIKTSKWIAIHSDNDPSVPLDNASFFEANIQAKVIIQHNKGHYSERDTNEIPVVLDELLKIIK